MIVALARKLAIALWRYVELLGYYSGVTRPGIVAQRPPGRARGPLDHGQHRGNHAAQQPEIDYDQPRGAYFGVSAQRPRRLSRAAPSAIS